MHIIFDEKKSNFTYNDSCIAKYINENPMRFSGENIETVAKMVNVSVASVSRFVYKNHFESFKQLQLFVKTEYETKIQNYRTTNGSALEDTIQNIKAYNLYAINETISNIDTTSLNLLIEDIMSSRKILLYGVGSSWNACQELANNLCKVGINPIINRDFHNQLLSIPHMTSDDHLLLISKSGTTREIKELIKNANFYNIPVTIITSNINCGYEKFLHNKVIFKTYDQDKRFSAVSSKITQLILIDIIFNQIMKNHPEYESIITSGTRLVKLWNTTK